MATIEGHAVASNYKLPVNKAAKVDQYLIDDLIVFKVIGRSGLHILNLI